MGVIQLRGFITPFIFLLVVSLASASFFGDEKVIILEGSSGGTDLRTTDNIWNGTQEFDDDVTFNEEVYGTPHVIQTGNDASINLIKGTLYYMYWVDGVQFTNAAKGWTAERDGSIIGMSVTYDVVSAGGTGFPVLSFKTLINGITLGSPSVGGVATVGNQQQTRLTWARDTYQFSAGDTLLTTAFMQAFGGTPTLIIDDIIITTRIVYDD